MNIDNDREGCNLNDHEIVETKMIKIKHKTTSETLYLVDSGTLVKANLHGADLREANLHGADLRRANLSGTDLRGANLYVANLYGANLRGANLYEADLSGTDLYEADLRGANLYEADLCRANLYGADLCKANLYGAGLRGADLRGANLHGVTGDSRRIHTLQTPIWSVAICIDQNRMAIGCEQHSIDAWEKFKDSRIELMDIRALGFWKTWKPLIFQYINLLKPEQNKNT